MNTWFPLDSKCKPPLSLVLFGSVTGTLSSCERKDKIMSKFYFENSLTNYQSHLSHLVDSKLVILDKKVELYNEFAVGAENIIPHLSFLPNSQQGH